MDPVKRIDIVIQTVLICIVIIIHALMTRPR
jgi:hypothetical protein